MGHLLPSQAMNFSNLKYEHTTMTYEVRWLPRTRAI